MNKKIEMLFTVLVLFAMVGLANASSCTATSSGWCSIPYYYHWFNVTINNWNYTSVNAIGQPSQWALMTFNSSRFYSGQVSLTPDEQINIQGYTQSYQDIGYIPFIWLKGSGNNVSIEVSRYNVSGQAWNSITIFFSPTTSSVLGKGLVLSNISCENNGSCQPLFRNQLFVLYTSQSNSLKCNSLGYCVFANGKTTQLPPNISVSNIARVNFTSTNPFVVLTNRSMETRYFNITYNTGDLNQYVINSTGLRYKVYSIGSFNRAGAFVSSPEQFSGNANNLFGTSGYEGWFNTQGNYIITESMSTKGCGFGIIQCIYNSSDNVPTQSTIIPVTTGYFQLAVDTSVPTTYYIIPAFTTNYTIANNAFAYNNPTPIVNCTSGCNSTLEGWYYDFQNRTLIYGINWTYNFTTYAYFGSIGKSHNIVFGAGNVSYLMLNISSYANFGNDCSDMYLRAYVNGSDRFTPEPQNEDFGAIPFYVINCSSVGSNPRAYILLQNTTDEGYTYNSFYIYSGSISNFTNHGTFSDYGIYKNWIISKAEQNGNYTIYDTSNSPYLINLNLPLNSNSFVYVMPNGVYGIGNDGHAYAYGLDGTVAHDYTGFTCHARTLIKFG